ncbi:Down syndrome cell adhesion molecule homolog isoform X8 [Stegodyphus dumicola]|uniref:Down syndrome cell adhesion molecule homolog isoform X8 n=1 Tax=Stegodyphus dumicola TaxID=202533 RepID=UPI0015B08B4F|nr:Down syndrome cell adhesion molecule homolog isoform X8 [Stegodyphus dumicola]
MKQCMLYFMLYQLATFGYAFDAWKIQPFNFPVGARVGQRVSTVCTTSGGKTLNFDWLKDGKNVREMHHIKISTVSDVSTIIIEPVSESDSGNYTCVASSDGMTDMYVATLYVYVPPEWLSLPTDKDVLSGENVHLPCAATGKPKPNISWNKYNEIDGKFYSLIMDHANAGSDKVILHSNGSLNLIGVNKEDEGVYQCIVSNDVGAPLKKSANLRVIVPARFEEKFTLQSVRRGETATLKCEAIGDKPLSITWTKDKAEIDFKKHTRLEKFDRDVEKGLSSELIIRTSDRKDGAIYGCLAKNEYGSDERNVKLLVVEVPNKPLDVKVKEVWSRTASITWPAPYSGNKPITKYIIQYWRNRGGPHRLLEETVPSSHTTVLLKNLQPGTPYAVTVLGENEIGQGLPSDILELVTGEEEPSGPPTDVWVEAKSSSSILVTWKPPPRELWNGQLRGYFVGYKVDGSSHPYSFKTVDNVVEENQEYTLTNLTKSNKYNIVVKAYNSAGTGPPSQDLVAKPLDGGFKSEVYGGVSITSGQLYPKRKFTAVRLESFILIERIPNFLPDVPGAPAFTVVAASESKISLRWGDPPSRNIPVTGYTLHYKKEGGEWFHIPIIASSSKNRFTITGLESSTAYKIFITASNQYGNGEPSDITTVTTSMKGFVIGNTETYVDLSVIVPVAACILAFIVVTIVVIIYYRKSKARNSLERAFQGGKPFPYTGSTQRYIDIDKTRLPAEPGTLTSSYATIPANELTDEATQEMKAFMHGNMKDRPLPSKPSSMKKKNKGHVYDTAQ